MAMLKSPPASRLLLAATLLLAPFTVHLSAKAAQFEQSEVDARLFIAIARPYGDQKHDLLILQQIPGKKQCWQEQGANPTTIVPLLLNFDFTGICDRSTDSNGYSVRVEGKDLGLEYLLSIVEREGDLWLVGKSRLDPNQPDLLIGRTHGVTKGFLKIELEPGWRFTKRTFRGQVLSHVYLTGDRAVLKAPSSNLASNPASNPKSNPSAPNPSTPINPDQALTAQPIKELTFTADPALVNPPDRSSASPLPLSPDQLSPPRPPVPNSASLPPLPALNPPRPTTPLTQPSSPSLPPLSPRSNNARSLPPVPVPRSVPPSSSLSSQSLPPLPLSPASGSSLSSSPSSLPPPPAVTNLPPAPLPSSGSGRKSLSDILTVSPRAGTISASMNANLSELDRPPVPRPSRLSETGEMARLDRSAIANQSSYRVLVNPGNQQEQVRSRYPDAFATSYQGRSLWQIGRFSSPENAQKALSDLSNLGVQGIIVP